MKKLFIVAFLALAVVFQYCTGTRRAASKKPAKITYIGHVQPIISSTCSPCHIPSKGNKKPLDTYASAKDEIDEMIRRIQKNPGEKGFMPFRHPKKLPDSTINVFVKWKEDGLLEGKK
jgi:uncharacterized membrane protein